jgi:hypothetical protein
MFVLSSCFSCQILALPNNPLSIINSPLTMNLTHPMIGIDRQGVSPGIADHIGGFDRFWSVYLKKLSQVVLCGLFGRISGVHCSSRVTFFSRLMRFCFVVFRWGRAISRNFDLSWRAVLSARSENHCFKWWAIEDSSFTREIPGDVGQREMWSESQGANISIFHSNVDKQWWLIQCVHHAWSIVIVRLSFALIPGLGGSQGRKLAGTCHFDATFAFEAVGYMICL